MDVAMKKSPFISMAISGTDEWEVPTIQYMRPMFQAYVSGNLPTKYGQKSGTKVPTHFRILEFPLIIEGISSLPCRTYAGPGGKGLSALLGHHANSTQEVGIGVAAR